MIHAVLIAYNNPDRTRRRWERDVRPALCRTGRLWAVTCVDNSESRSSDLADLFGADYLWQEGRNLLYGPSINLAAARRPESHYLLYACTQHGMALDLTWILDLLWPFERPDGYRDESVGQSGYLMGSNSPEGVAHALNCPWIKERFRFTDAEGTGEVPQHVQGGVFLARNSLVLAHPYPPEIPHLYTDHFLTWAILKAGYRCVNVPSVKSVWRNTVTETHGLKYVHADNFT